MTDLIPGPDLTEYDVIIVNTSAGKDSQVALDVTVHAARAAGVADRVIAVHDRGMGNHRKPYSAHRASTLFFVPSSIAIIGG